ncbi:hypothetical protein BU24DRAFT_465541 [Aaosphaeria arxii CBS 175.79]|uniref:Uncharacterized protein n=1 Tax=Aaosphaeria arxii CBS 175.79 TaxID=1450172 RepID=A0A6A5XFV1_9PLEO|nr:uncharacterized protein BU24DRAFT_465541 [Aaosphaeria arxii CBS 175.79]KAF2011962.1 hypothetical protein BU24DRAFT_465541 [Aaosphaeria arxii CBS 175.79]
MKLPADIAIAVLFGCLQSVISFLSLLEQRRIGTNVRGIDVEANEHSTPSPEGLPEPPRSPSSDSGMDDDARPPKS